MDTLGLRVSPRQVAQKKKQLDSTLNHACFTHVDITSEEDAHLIKQTCSLPETMNSPRKTEFVASIEKKNKESHQSQVLDMLPQG